MYNRQWCLVVYLNVNILYMLERLPLVKAFLFQSFNEILYAFKCLCKLKKMTEFFYNLLWLDHLEKLDISYTRSVIKVLEQ